jgi:hypothetical protein
VGKLVVTASSPFLSFSIASQSGKRKFKYLVEIGLVLIPSGCTEYRLRSTAVKGFACHQKTGTKKDYSKKCDLLKILITN